MAVLPIGSKNGRLTILEHIPGGKHPLVRCRCECGTEKLVQRYNLPRTHSCGCLKREQLQAKATHGMSNSPEYRAWNDMRERCSRPGRKDFERYGGRGITVCERWVSSFANFYADMGPKPSKKHTIDRIDTNGNYEPGNCRWATAKEQRINQRRQVLFTHEGITGTVKDLCIHFGANKHTVHDRMWRLGWNIHDALAAGIKVTVTISKQKTYL